MGDQDVDPDVALAELALDRLDGTRQRSSPDDLGPAPEVIGFDESDGIRIDGEGEVAETRDPYADTHDIDEAAEAVDAFDEAFNARDLESLLEVLAEDVECPGLGNDRDNLPGTVEDLWDRRPTAILTRGWLDTRCVSVLWEPATGGGWWRTALVHFDDVHDGRIGVVELNDDQVALDEVQTDGPDGDVEEGTRWEEWAEGDGD